MNGKGLCLYGSPFVLVGLINDKSKMNLHDIWGQQMSNAIKASYTNIIALASSLIRAVLHRFNCPGTFWGKSGGGSYGTTGGKPWHNSR
jgi:hypothetical protein